LIAASRVGITEKPDRKACEMRDAETIVGLIRERGRRGLPLEQVYRLLFNQNLYLRAYGKIYRNTGAMTHGVTDETPDGMSLKKIDAIIEALRYERYQWLPARRVYIPKKNGKKRPLGMPVWSDKLLQEVIRLILEAYFEPQFSDHSHGFRPERGCHTALREIYYKWSGTIWFIEGDISQCFDRLSHELLIQELSEHIHDGKFIRLMQELLDAGYMEDWTYSQTLSGVPQGGVISPLLANILLNRLDRFVEDTLIPQYTKGEERRRNPEYMRLMKKASKCRKKGQTEQAESLRKQAQRIPSMDANDPDFRRLRYVRYADDFLLGYVGTKAEAEEIKRQLQKFLQEELKLELSEAKTLITHARSEAARFLGYKVTILHNEAKRTKDPNTGNMDRSINGRIGLQVPKDVLEEKCGNYTRNKKAVHRAEWMQESDFTIVAMYQLEFRGIANYYKLAYNMHTLTKLKGVMETSLTKTLATKYKVSVPNIYEKYGTRLEVNGKEYKVLQVVIPREGKRPLVATWGGVPLSWDIKATLKEKLSVIWRGERSELVQRLLAEVCELCGSRDDVEVHHVRKMKNLHEYPGRPKPEWVVRMIALKRKTLLLCRACHEDVDLGRPLRRQIIEYSEVQAVRKEAVAVILESRMP
jgi:group II intron reverse transcriptase/maturase